VKCVIVIPARMASTRFPGKPLVDLCGRPMVQWVYDAAVQSQVSNRVVVATPDEEIYSVAKAFGAEAVMTRQDHPSRTDRLAEVESHFDAEVFLNVQGDEPLIDPKTIQACAAPFVMPEVAMSSVFTDCHPDEEHNPAAVKVVTDLAGYALYFSRYAIPFERNPRGESLKKHVGIYGFRKETLLAFSKWPQSPLEQAESLEQLRFLENGVRIKMERGEASPVAVDTPEQAEAVRAILAER